ncbi:MAG TPA: dockerin type I domain-containing protein [Thermoguttaceae bacterium]|nr:dockerin type I domain-containing protein [Thermoguttaceae bacterium]
MKWSSFLCLFAAAIALTFAVGQAGATEIEAVANFDGGGTDAVPVTDVVDAYTGMAGDGWAEGWYKYTNNATYTVGTNNTAPLSTLGGNYLDLTMTPNDVSTGRYCSVSRYYTDPLEGIDVTLSHSVDFQFRVNEDFGILFPVFSTSNDRYQMFDAPTHTQGNGGPNCSWLISCYGGSATWLDASKVGHWVVYNGDNLGSAASDAAHIDTGITVTQNTVYDFHVDVDAVTKTYDVKISLGETTLYDSLTSGFENGLGWRTNAATTAGLPHFGCFGDNSSDTRSYSLDNVKITGTQVPPPPAPLTLVAAQFTGGNGDTVVDAYAGIPGDGWRTAWAPATSRADVVAAVIMPGVGGFSELHTDKGAYLSVTSTQNTADNTGLASVNRDYKVTDTYDESIDWAAEHTIKFTVRIDEDVATFTDFDDRYLIFDAASSQSGVGPNCTWIVNAYGGEGTYAGADVVGQWSFYNGDRLGGDLSASLNVDTNIDITTGGVYDFTIVVDPTTQSYDATVSDGTNTFTATDLGWRTTATEVGGYLSFASRSSENGEVRAFSLDEVLITTATAPTVPGDTDGDNIVDADDAAILAGNWGVNVGTGGATEGDFNDDGWVNALDASILAANWGDHNPVGGVESGSPVPEPSVIILLLGGLTLLVARRR